jgi:hypothetical protein
MRIDPNHTILFDSEPGGIFESPNHFPRAGRIVGLTESGQARVDFPGNTGGPLAARTLITLDLPLAELQALSVLLIFEDAHFRRPVIAGVIRDRLLPDAGSAPGERLELKADQVFVDKKKISLRAAEMIELKCGKSSLTLTRDGKVVIKGAELLSRASGTQRIKGASVEIN